MIWGEQTPLIQSLLQQKVSLEAGRDVLSFDFGRYWKSSDQGIRIVIYTRDADYGQFDCCGYFNSTSPGFVQDNICMNELVAAQKDGCISRFSSFANSYLDIVFTAAFGMVVVDAILVLCVAMVIQYRHEQERYRHIDEKNGLGGI
jgi:hypothetical protein